MRRGRAARTASAGCAALWRGCGSAKAATGRRCPATSRQRPAGREAPDCGQCLDGASAAHQNALARSLRERPALCVLPPRPSPTRRPAMRDDFEEPLPYRAASPPFPGTVTAAGIIWIVIGSLILLYG